MLRNGNDDIYFYSPGFLESFKNDLGSLHVRLSSQISPNFTTQNFSVLNFIFLIKTDLKQDAKFFRMEDLRPKFIEQIMLQEENDD